jgi:hypothetical protein
MIELLHEEEETNNQRSQCTLVVRFDLTEDVE